MQLESLTAELASANEAVERLTGELQQVSKPSFLCPSLLLVSVWSHVALSLTMQAEEAAAKARDDVSCFLLNVASFMCSSLFVWFL